MSHRLPINAIYTKPALVLKERKATKGDCLGKSVTVAGTKPAIFIIEGHQLTAPTLNQGLYIVATPIGNLRDITIRALQTLAAADLILCEDTRQSARLLDHYGIKTRRMALHEHNERDRIDPILEMLREGKAIALISDAGTPLLSDPGFPLVRAVRDADFNVFAVPGASALLSALTVAGLPTDRFTFVGFPPTKSSARSTLLNSYAGQTETLIFYDASRRLKSAIAAMQESFGPDRQAVIALELTKKFERTLHGTLNELESALDEATLKGEAVIVVAGAKTESVDDTLWQEALVAAIETQPLRSAVDEITETFSLKRKQVYNAALALKKNKG